DEAAACAVPTDVKATSRELGTLFPTRPVERDLPALTGVDADRMLPHLVEDVEPAVECRDRLVLALDPGIPSPDRATGVVSVQELRGEIRLRIPDLHLPDERFVRHRNQPPVAPSPRAASPSWAGRPVTRSRPRLESGPSVRPEQPGVSHWIPAASP